jgi:hypothetical protein
MEMTGVQSCDVVSTWRLQFARRDHVIVWHSSGDLNSSASFFLLNAKTIVRGRNAAVAFKQHPGLLRL